MTNHLNRTVTYTHKHEYTHSSKAKINNKPESAVRVKPPPKRIIDTNKPSESKQLNNSLLPDLCQKYGYKTAAIIVHARTLTRRSLTVTRGNQNVTTDR